MNDASGLRVATVPTTTAQIHLVPFVVERD